MTHYRQTSDYSYLFVLFTVLADRIDFLHKCIDVFAHLMREVPFELCLGCFCVRPNKKILSVLDSVEGFKPLL